MKDKIETYVAPDMSGFDKNLAVDEDMNYKRRPNFIKK